jgi:hypothetical protein
VIDDQHSVCLHLGQVEPQRRDIRGEISAGLLEGDEDPWLAVLGDSANEELHPEEGLAATGRPAHQGRPTAGEPTAGDLVEAGDARRCLGQWHQSSWRST